ncbi:MAG: hypothetical protein AB2784_05630 [Candidatus Thiodiazotropha endolucinida]
MTSTDWDPSRSSQGWKLPLSTRVDVKVMFLYEDQRRQINIELIASLNTFKDALLLCKSISGLDDDVIADRLGMTIESFIGIWSGECFFPMEKLIEFMRICENITPIIWLGLKCGYRLDPLEDKLEQELRLRKRETAELEDKISFIRNDVLGNLLDTLIDKASSDPAGLLNTLTEMRASVGRGEDVIDSI